MHPQQPLSLNTLKRLLRHINPRLSTKLSLMVSLSTAVLLMVALLVMLHYSRNAVKEEAMKKAEQTLEGTVQHIDNILLNVEQSSGNVYWNMLIHLDKLEKMFEYSRNLVASNPYIIGAAIALEPYYYKERGKYFMAYAHRSEGQEAVMETDTPIIQAETFGHKPYNEQEWYTQAMNTGHPCWIGPLKDSDTDGGAIITFCLPLWNRTGQRIGVMGVDVALSQLSKIVMATKPSPNSYCTLLRSDGSYIVHPDSIKLQHQTVYSYAEASGNQGILDAAVPMMSGHTGYKKFQQMNDDWYVFYKPFHRSAVPGRSMEKLEWSAGIIYPEDDIFGEYNRLSYYVIAIALIGLVLLLVLSWTFTHKQLLPLRMLSLWAQHVADGHYDATIPDSRQVDEIGRLQNHFQQMQLSLAHHVSELERLKTSLQQQRQDLQAAYEEAQEADQLKTAFLHNMTNQMIAPTEDIIRNVTTLCNNWSSMSQDEAAKAVDDIQKKSKTITELLNSLLNVKTETMG